MCTSASELYYSFTKKRFVYNITPIENIPSILEHGLMSYDKMKALVHRSIALNTVQERREKVILPNGTRLHSYANMYFSYWNPMLCKRKDISASLCILAFNATVLDIPGCVLTDRNAATSLVRFYTPLVGLRELDFERIHAKYWTDDDIYVMRENRAVKCAEILIPQVVPSEFINSACVYNDNAKQALVEMGFHKDIYVAPDNFF